MAGFSVTMTVGGVGVVVDLATPVPWAEVRARVLAAAELPAKTRLYLGGEPVDPGWPVGRPPLVNGVVLASRREPAPPPVAAVLACVAGPDAGHDVGLVPDRAVRAGRGPDCDLRLDDPGLSRREALIGLTPDGVRVRDPQRPSADGIVVPLGAPFRLGDSLLRADPPAGPGLEVRADGRGRVVVARPPRLNRSFHVELPPEPGPPPERARHPVPLVAAGLGAVLGVTMALLTGLWMFLLLAALGPLTMVGTAVGDRVTGRRGHRRQVAEHRRHAATDQLAVDAAVRADRTDAWDRFADPATLLDRVATVGPRLWERRPEDADFLALSLGWGCRPARVDRPKPPAVTDVPLVVDLRRIGVLGLTGAARPLLRSILAQLLVLHPPSALRLVVCSRAADLAAVAQAPHLSRPDGGADLIRAPSDLPEPVGAGTTVLVLDGPDWRQSGAVQTWLTAAGADAPALAVCVADRPDQLPAECRVVVGVHNGRLEVTGAAGTWDGTVTGVDEAHLTRIGQALAALVDQDDQAGRLPRRVDLDAATGLSPCSAAVRARWTRPGLAATLGLGTAGPVEIDLERDGPHLLIAGTTGAGKSELLRTLVLGLALSGAPDRTSLLLVDYKGGAAFGALVELPHVLGVVTDLDGELAGRALRSLRGELERREHTLAQAGVADLAGLRIRRPQLAFPSLVLVVDEFATLAVELPEFLSGLLDVAQRGRSLGVHLVLATQRPAGVLSPAVRSNIGARICLRVTDAADSLDVLGDPGAARIAVATPGRALLRIGAEPPHLFQTARVATPSRAAVSVRRSDHPPAGDLGSEADPGAWVAAIRSAADGHPRPRPVWRPPLPAVVPARDVADDVLAVLDRPAVGDQLPFAATGSLLVTGPPGSGRSATVRRWARQQAGAGSVIVVLGSGPAGVDTWPATLTRLDLSDPGLVHRLVTRLRGELGHRTATRDEPGIVVLADGIEQLVTVLDQLDFGVGTAALGELIGSGPPVGIRVGATGDVRFAQHRLAAQFATVVRLGTDERDTVRVGTPPGRGWITGLSAQVVWEDPVVPGPPADPDRMEHAGRRGLRVQPLPAHVERRSLPAPRLDAIPVGLGGDGATPAVVDLAGTGGGFLVAGPRRSGVTTVLRILAEACAAAGVSTVRLDWRPQSTWPGVRTLDQRAGPDATERFLVNHDGPLVLVAEAPDEDDPTAPLLLRYLAVAGPGQHLVLGTRLDRATRSHRGLLAEVAAFRTGLLLQADAADGHVLDAVLPRRRGQPRPGSGHLVRHGEVTAVQIAWPG